LTDTIERDTEPKARKPKAEATPADERRVILPKASARETEFAVILKTENGNERHYEFHNPHDMVTAFRMLKDLQWVDHAIGWRPVWVWCAVNGERIENPL
jgi:hypothetical protein